MYIMMHKYIIYPGLSSSPCASAENLEMQRKEARDDTFCCVTTNRGKCVIVPRELRSMPHLLLSPTAGSMTR